MDNFQFPNIELIYLTVRFGGNIEYMRLIEKLESREFAFLFGVLLDVVMKDSTLTFDGEVLIGLAGFFHDNIFFEF